jgi:hypothetical protein
LNKEIHLKGVGHLCAFVGSTPILATLNPVFWTMTIVWFVAQPEFLREVFPAPVYYVGLILWSFGNFLLWYLTVLTARHIEREGLVLAAVLVPIYWVMMSIAALKATWQLIVTPSFWEKTAHGLDSEYGANEPEKAEPLRLVS